MDIFQASAQYDDWRGSAAADRSHATRLSDLLLERDLRTREEFLVGAELSVSEDDNTITRTTVYAYLVDGVGFEHALQALERAGSPPALKRVRVDLTLEEFVSLFKLFSVTLSIPAFGLEGREYIAR
ncbi:hypothetical protein [Burkholderia gladioli]|uniref:hypothetical protein n=1 Tax=Burkholderia gladioli TaxID=28095 RepID=UPI001C5CFEE3|nr:hypothetical protein [Burkholderia gladioli]MBW5284219.1 hypothetical protein [Burkholderia gladioli]